MKISLVMGTLNREHLAIRAIKSIINQNFFDWEIIVIDQSEKASKIIPTLDKKIVYIQVTEKGLSKARNLGIKLAHGEVIGLMDDDAVYYQDTLRKVNDHFSSKPNLFLLSGKIVDFSQMEINLQNSKETLTTITWNNFMKGLCISPSLFIKKEFFKEEAFDENLGVGCYLGSAEESDVVAKILNEKKTALHDSSIIVFHHTGESKYEIDIKRHASYCRGFGAFCAKHIIRYKNQQIYKLYNIRMFRTKIGLLIARIKHDKFLIDLYKTTLDSRKEGYMLYKTILQRKDTIR